MRHFVVEGLYSRHCVPVYQYRVGDDATLPKGWAHAEGDDSYGIQAHAEPPELPPDRLPVVWSLSTTLRWEKDVWIFDEGYWIYVDDLLQVLPTKFEGE